MLHTRHVRLVYLSNWAQTDDLTNFTYVHTNSEGAAIKDCCGPDHLKRSTVPAIYQTREQKQLFCFNKTAEMTVGWPDSMFLHKSSFTRPHAPDLGLQAQCDVKQIDNYMDLKQTGTNQNYSEDKLYRITATEHEC